MSEEDRIICVDYSRVDSRQASAIETAIAEVHSEREENQLSYDGERVCGTYVELDDFKNELIRLSRSLPDVIEDINKKLFEHRACCKPVRK